MNSNLFSRWSNVIFSSAFVTFFAGCSALGALNTFVPERGVTATRDIVYGPNTRNKLDVYQPKALPPATPPTTVAKPVVVFFYGGAWDSGDKSSYFFMAEALTSRGYVVVMPDYRVYPEVVFPLYMDDAALAIKWTFDNAAQYGGDPNKIFLMGHSAGAQLAALAAYDAQYLSAVGVDKRRIKGVVSVAGPMDFLPLTEEKLFLIFPENVRAASQPVNFINGHEPPTLLIHGLADTRVGIHNSRNLAARIRQYGGQVEEAYYPETGHVGILLQFAAPLRNGKPALERVAKFIDARTVTQPLAKLSPLVYMSQ